ncbi:MAG: hypothetical protein AB8G77_26345, partial [Rhodothermales bacterium]
HRNLRNTILRLYNQKGKPSGVALFSSPLMPSGEIYMYLSPAACETFSRMFKAYRTKPCAKPAKEEVKLILGQRETLVMLQE